MPYRSVADLPAAQVRRYTATQKRAFLHAFNSSLQRGLPENHAFAIAHAAAQRAGGGAPRVLRLRQRAPR